jgi:hypothetical protein
VRGVAYRYLEGGGGMKCGDRTGDEVR